MSQNVINFIQSFLENVNVPVNFMVLPEDDLTQIDHGLRGMLPGPGYDTLFANQWFSQMEPCTIYHSRDIFHCCYSILYLPENKRFMICGPVLLEEIDHETFLEIALNMNIPEESYPILKDYYLQLSYFPSIGEKESTRLSSRILMLWIPGMNYTRAARKQSTEPELIFP